MIGIDTNVLLRLLLDDEPAQSARIDAWLSSQPAAVGQVHIADVVLAEAAWTLVSVFEQSKSEFLKAMRALLAEPMFGFEDRAAVAAAVAAFESSACGFPDCLIVAKNRSVGCTATATFDKRMRRLEGVTLL